MTVDELTIYAPAGAPDCAIPGVRVLLANGRQLCAPSGPRPAAVPKPAAAPVAVAAAPDVPGAAHVRTVARRKTGAGKGASRRVGTCVRCRISFGLTPGGALPFHGAAGAKCLGSGLPPQPKKTTRKGA